MKNLNQGILARIELSLPPLSTQRSLVAEVDEELKIIDANRSLIAKFGQRVDSVLASVWGESVGRTDD